MSSFTKNLTITKIKIKVKKNRFFAFFSKNKYKNIDRWRVERAFDYHVGSEDSEEIIHIPDGLVTDGASIPRFLWVIVGHPMDEFAQAAVVHDYLYSLRGIYAEDRIYSRKRCDEIFYEAMGALKVPKWKRIAMYQAVRCFGGIPW